MSKPTFKQFLIETDKNDGMYCEEVFTDAEGNILDEGAQIAFKKSGKEIKRYYRCITGPKAGHLVASPKECGQRKNPKKVRAGKKVARTKKFVRIRKSKVTQKTALHKKLVDMNKRLAGKPITPNKSTK